MKNLISCVALFCIVVACNNSSMGTKMDLSTGLSVNYNGFSIDDAFLANDKDERLQKNEVAVGQTIAVIFQGVDNYYKQDGRVFPILDILVTDKNGVVVLEGKDIFGSELQQQNGFTPEYAANLEGTITIGNPMTSGETYNASMKITDKLNPENVIDAKVDLVIK